MEKPPSKRVLTTAVVEPFRKGFYDTLGHMPDPDDILEAEGDDIYDRMLADEDIWAAWFQVIVRILGRTWEIKASDSTNAFAVEVQNYVQETFQELALDTKLEHLLSGLSHKYAVSQVIYREEQTHFMPERLVAMDQHLFAFKADGSLVITKDGELQEAPSFKFIVHANERRPGKPYGTSLLKRVYWPWRLKNEGWELWTTAMDRFSVPSLVAIFEMVGEDEGKAKEMAEEIAGILAQVASGSTGALANTTDVKQIGGLKAVEGFDVYIEMCIKAIMKGILTVTLTTEEGRQGRERGNTQVHDEAANRVARWYGRKLEETITQSLVRFTAVLRYGEKAERVLPRFCFDWKEAISWEQLLEAIDRGVPVSKQAVYAGYNVPEPADKGDVLVLSTSKQE